MSLYRKHILRGLFLISGLLILGMFIFRGMDSKPSPAYESVEGTTNSFVKDSCNGDCLPENLCPRHGNPVLAREPGGKQEKSLATPANSKKVF